LLPGLKESRIEGFVPLAVLIQKLKQFDDGCTPQSNWPRNADWEIFPENSGCSKS